MNRNNTEIERKFLVERIPGELDKYKCFDIKQAYISTSPTMRIRKKDNSYIFTFKGKGTVKKTEFEYPLTEEQFDSLMKKTEGRVIEKNRYIIPLDGGLVCELDIYKGELEGFVNAEVEFTSMEEAESFVPPDWFGKDISEDKRYSNASLSRFHIPSE